MLKKLLVALVATLAALGFANFAQAEPGPNGSNDHGLCTAYFNGQKNGHGEGEDQSNQPRPFQGLEDAGYAYTNNDDVNNDRDSGADESDPQGPNDEGEQLTDAENIYNYCSNHTIIGGNPEHGRFTCVDAGGTDADGSDSNTDPECNENAEPGNS